MSQPSAIGKSRIHFLLPDSQIEYLWATKQESGATPSFTVEKAVAAYMQANAIPWLAPAPAKRTSKRSKP